MLASREIGQVSPPFKPASQQERNVVFVGVLESVGKMYVTLHTFDSGSGGHQGDPPLPASSCLPGDASACLSVKSDTKGKKK